MDTASTVGTDATLTVQHVLDTVVCVVPVHVVRAGVLTDCTVT